MNETLIQMSAAGNSPFLAEVYRWGIDVIKTIQVIKNPALTAFVKAFTALGTQPLYVVTLLVLFWCVNEKKALKLGILVILSGWVNLVVKDLLKQPRPYNLEPSVGMAFEPSYGIPSGHAQNSLSFWAPLAAWRIQVLTEKAAKKLSQKIILIRTGTVLFILFMGFTRLYLGVHFPTDLAAGWILALIFIALWFIPGPRIEKFLAAAGARKQIICIAVLTLAMNGIFPKDRSLPALFFGFCAGYTLMKKRFPFSAAGGSKLKKPLAFVLRCVIGFAGMAVIYAGLKLLFPGEGSLFSNIPIWGEDSPFYEIGRFIRYGLVGLWASAGAPWVFMRTGLAHNEKPKAA